MILVVLGLCSSQGVLGIAEFCQCGGISVVGIGQLGIGIAQGSLEARSGIDGGLVSSVGGIQLGQLIVARRARGKGGLVVDGLKIGLERLVAGKLGLGLMISKFASTTALLAASSCFWASATPATAAS